MQADLPDAPDLQFTPAIIRRVSHWREFGGDGRQLLAEHGHLAGVSLRLTRDSGVGRLHLMVERVGGDRAYNGQTNTGTPAETSVALAETALELGVDHPLVAGWSGTFAAARLSVDRRLADMAAASGYVEHWRWMSWRPGLAWRGDLAPDGELVVSATLGWSSHRSLLLEQAGRDPARLEPGQGLRREVTIGYLHRLNDGSQLRWTWQADWSWSDTKFSASSAVPVFSNGVLRGGALQPATRTGATDLRLGLSLHWF